MKRSFKLIIMMAIICQSCQQELPPAQILLGETTVNAEYDAGEMLVEFTSTRPWTVEMPSEWCKVIPESGGGGAAPTTLHIILEKNSTPDDRTCHFTVLSEGVSKDVSVVQSCIHGILVNTHEYNVPSNEVTMDIGFWKNEPFTVDTDDSWISVLATKSMESASITLSISKNTSRARDGIIHIRCGEQEETVTVHQAPSDITLQYHTLNQYCHNHFDTDGDGCFSIDEALQVKSLSFVYYDWTKDDLSYFANLEEISITVASNADINLRMLPLLKKLVISGRLTSLDLSGNPLLETLEIQSNGVKTLDLTNNPLCRSINIYESRYLTTIYLIKGIEYDIRYDPSITTLIYK